MLLPLLLSINNVGITIVNLTALCHLQREFQVFSLNFTRATESACGRGSAYCYDARVLSEALE